MDNPLSLTSASLLGRVCSASADESAWTEFVERYAPRIYGWCLQHNLQQADAEDVTQTVLSTLFRRLGKFQYDPDLSFRGWLRKVTQDALSDFFRGRGRKDAAEGGSEMLALIATLEARKLLEQQLEELFDLELMNEALLRVQQRVQPNRWRAYEMTALEGRPGGEVAEQLSMKVAVVYSAKSKVQQMIKQEIANMENAPASSLSVPSSANSSS